MSATGKNLALALGAAVLLGAGYGLAHLPLGQADSAEKPAAQPARPGPGAPAGGRQRPPASVFAEPVTYRNFALRAEAIGTLEPREAVQLSVNAADRVTAVFFEDGQRVRAGQTLLTLAQREQAAAIAAAEASVSETRSNLERRERLFSENAISTASLEQARRDAETAAANLRTVQSRQRDRILVAPFEGILGFRQVSEGAYLRPGDPVATLIDDSEMRLEFPVPSQLLADVAPGTAVRARSDDLPGLDFEGTVTSLDNAIDPVTRTFRVRASLPNPQRLMRAGMFMKVDLLARPRESLAVPEGALEAEGPRHFLYVLVDRDGATLAERREVTIGLREASHVEILSGLSEGDRVVTDGLIQLRPGATVTVRDRSLLDPALRAAADQGKGGGEATGIAPSIGSGG